MTKQAKAAKTESQATLVTLVGVYECMLAVTAKTQAVAQRDTLQRGATPTNLGKGWHKGCKPAVNSRFTTLSVLAALPQPFTYSAACAALAALPAGTLGSGTPRSYLVAFVKEGYLSAYAA